MSEWIDINLPWRSHLPHWEFPTRLYPNLSSQLKEEFGFDYQTLRDEYFPDKTENLYQHKDFEHYEQVILKFEDQFPEVGWGDINEPLEAKLRKLQDPIVSKILDYHEQVRIMREWEKNHPDHQAATKKYQEEYAAAREKESQLSFCGRKLNQSGTLIEANVDGQVQQLLIGDINKMGGRDVDYDEIGSETMILRYKVIWEYNANETKQGDNNG